jgi:outer membrane protein TolC
MRGFFSFVALSFALSASAAETPLSLDEALAHAGRPHPDLGVAQAQVELARAEHLLAESQNDFRLTLEAGLRSGRNSLSNGFEADHLARLNARKTLWDSGRTRLAGEAAQIEIAGRDGQLLDTLAQRRLALMTRFFDVLVTDLRYAADNEFSAVAYVSWDNARDRQQLGEMSSAQLAEYEARYQESRLLRNDTLRQAREKRALLAAAMNRPGELPSELSDPEIKGNDRPLPEFDDLLAAMRETNPRLQAQRQLLAAAQKRLELQRAGNRPSLEFETETAAYSRDAYTRDNLRAGFNLVWPLYQGQRVDSLLAREQAYFQLLQAEHDRLMLDLRQALFDTREEIVHLIESERPAAKVDSTLRDWNLERAQAEYELELKTNLGSSMAETQAARLRRKAVEYRLALAWERLAALLGQSPDTIKKKEDKKT